MKTDTEYAIFDAMCRALAWSVAADMALSAGSLVNSKRWGEAADMERLEVDRLLEEERNETKD